MIQFAFSTEMRSVLYAAIAVGTDTLYVINTSHGSLPVWLREHMVNAVSGYGSQSPRRHNVIDLTQVRALRHAPLPRTGTVH